MLDCWMGCVGFWDKREDCYVVRIANGLYVVAVVYITMIRVKWDFHFPQIVVHCIMSWTDGCHGLATSRLARVRFKIAQQS